MEPVRLQHKLLWTAATQCPAVHSCSVSGHHIARSLSLAFVSRLSFFGVCLGGRVTGVCLWVALHSTLSSEASSSAISDMASLSGMLAYPTGHSCHSVHLETGT